MTMNSDAGDQHPNATDAEDIAADDAATETGAQRRDADTIAALEAEKLDLKDRLMRALAETENMRRRAEREAKDAKAYAITGFARDMLTVADNINRALDSAKAGDGADSPAVQALVQGVELTERDLQATLARHGVRLLEPEGQKFDPNFHQAMFEVPTEEVPSGTVVQVVQSGYAIGDRVLRPAMVGVAKGSAKPASGTEASEN